MSSRVLKKLQGEPDLNIREEDDDELSDDLSHGGGGTPKKQTNINRYDLVSAYANASEIADRLEIVTIAIFAEYSWGRICGWKVLRMHLGGFSIDFHHH